MKASLWIPQVHVSPTSRRMRSCSSSGWGERSSGSASGACGTGRGLAIAPGAATGLYGGARQSARSGFQSRPSPARQSPYAKVRRIGQASIRLPRWRFRSRHRESQIGSRLPSRSDLGSWRLPRSDGVTQFVWRPAARAGHPTAASIRSVPGSRVGAFPGRAPPATLTG